MQETETPKPSITVTCQGMSLEEMEGRVRKVRNDAKKLNSLIDSMRAKLRNLEGEMGRALEQPRRERPEGKEPVGACDITFNRAYLLDGHVVEFWHDGDPMTTARSLGTVVRLETSRRERG